MIEYKVISPALGFLHKTEKFEDILNKYAKAGWKFTSTVGHHNAISYIIFEREKMR